MNASSDFGDGPNPYAAPHLQQQPNPGPRKNNTVLYIGAGCAAALMLSCVICAAGWFFFASNLGGMAADLMHTGMVQQTRLTPLPDEQKTEIIHEFDRLRDGYKDGDLTWAEAVTILDELNRTSLRPYLFYSSHVGPSGLSDEEKEQARLTIDRFARGVHDGAIAAGDAERAFAGLEPIIDPQDEEFEPQPVSSDAAVRDILARLKQQADDAGVSETPEPVDVAADVRRLIDSHLGASTP